MIRASIAALACLLFISPAAADDDGKEWVSYGKPQTIVTAPLQAKDLLSDPGAHLDKKILVQGIVADVCQKAGCWLVHSVGDKSIRVLTKDHGFTVAKDSTGQACRIEGFIRSKDIKPEEVEHFKGESMNKKVIPELKVQGTKTFELVASSIQLLRTKK